MILISKTEVEVFCHPPIKSVCVVITPTHDPSIHLAHTSISHHDRHLLFSPPPLESQQIPPISPTPSTQPNAVPTRSNSNPPPLYPKMPPPPPPNNPHLNPPAHKKTQRIPLHPDPLQPLDHAHDRDPPESTLRAPNGKE